MNPQQFRTDLQVLRERVAAWGRSAAPLTDSPDRAEAGEEIRVAMEELHVIEEELRRQNAELVLAREAAEAERRRYQDLFHFAPDGYLVTDLEGTIHEANRAAARLLGVPERFLAGKPLALFVAAEDRLAFRGELMHSLKEANLADLRLRLQPRHGAVVAVALTVGVITDRRGRSSGLRWLMRPAADPAAAASDDAAPHSLFEQAPSGMGRLTPDGRWLAANRKVCDLLGYRRDELLRRNVQDVTHPDDRALVAERLHALKSAQTPCAAECRWLHKDGPVLKVRWRASPLIDPSGARLGCLVVVEEVVGPVDAGLQSRVQELADADRRKDEFLAMLAHELRNPLAPLSLSLQVVRRGAAAGSEAARALDVAGHQVEKLTRLVEELLDVARIRQGKTDLRMGPVDLTAVAAAAVETVRPLLDERLHTLETALPSEPLRVQGDACRLEQVLGNLLTNAAKYTEPGGRIHLRIERDGDQAIVRVRDNGVGLVTELLPRIFEPFVQSERSLHRARGGLGLGLSLVKRFVELHGGSVGAYSDGPGRGSEFVVRLPALAPSPSGNGVAPEPPAPPRPVPVLVVDDNKDAADSMAQLLRLWGCEAAAAYDGPAAVAAARSRPPAVVFLDLGLPGMDGYETARRLRAAVPQAPLIIALTGFAGADEQLRTQQAGFDAHLVKPVDLHEVQVWVGRGAARLNVVG